MHSSKTEIPYFLPAYLCIRSKIIQFAFTDHTMQFESTFSHAILKKKVFFLVSYLAIAIISCLLFLAVNVADSIEISDIAVEIWVSFGLLNISGVFFILSFVEYTRMPPSQNYISQSSLSKLSVWSYDYIFKKIAQPQLKKHMINIKIKNRQQVRLTRKIYTNYPVKKFHAQQKRNFS